MFSQFNALTETYTWPVEVKFPKSGGAVGKITFDAEFKRTDAEEGQKILDDARVEQEDGSKILVYSKIVDAVLVGMKAKDDGGNYSNLPEDLQQKIRKISGADRSIFNAFSASINGEKVKN